MHMELLRSNTSKVPNADYDDGDISMTTSGMTTSAIQTSLVS